MAVKMPPIFCLFVSDYYEPYHEVLLFKFSCPQVVPVQLANTMAPVRAGASAISLDVWNVGFPHSPVLHPHQNLNPGVLIGTVGPIY